VRTRAFRPVTIVLALAVLGLTATAADGQPLLGGPLSGSPPGRLFPPDNWWSADITNAPVDPGSAGFIDFINDCTNCCPGGGQELHPDFGGEVETGSVEIYGIPYVVVDGTQPKRSVIFFYSSQSDGVDHSTNTSFPFYPLPDQAITQPHWIEGGAPGSVDLRSEEDRHLIVVDRDNRHLYELWNVWYDTAGGQWYAGSGAFFDLNMSHRRPETWTSADAAGFAMLPGLVRYEEVFHADPTGAYEIPHAFRVTVRDTNGYVYPASHEAGDAAGALPMGARLRLKASKDISGFPLGIQRIFRAMKKYGLLVSDNGTDMYVTGTFDTRWDNDVLNPAFAQLTACDFEVVQLGWRPQPRSRVLGDFDGDGNADALWRNNVTGAVTVWLLDGTSPIGSGSPGTAGGDWTIAGVGDFNGDGRDDVLWRHTSGAVDVWLLDGAIKIAAGSPGSAGTDWSIAAVGDFDGNGRADIVWRHVSGIVTIWFMDGTALASSGLVGTVTPDWTIVGAPDFNADGKADLLWRNVNGSVAVWLMSGAAVTAAAVPGGASMDWTIVGTGDLDGDGRADILWRHGGGTVTAWLMNGTGLVGSGLISTVAGDWHIAGVGDLDGDGRADLLWRSITGQVSGWLMNGTGVTTSGSPGGAPTVWQIQ
jgi:hypothetical protein